MVQDRSNGKLVKFHHKTVDIKRYTLYYVLLNASLLYRLELHEYFNRLYAMLQRHVTANS